MWKASMHSSKSWAVLQGLRRTKTRESLLGQQPSCIVFKYIQIWYACIARARHNIHYDWYILELLVMSRFKCPHSTAALASPLQASYCSSTSDTFTSTSSTPSEPASSLECRSLGGTWRHLEANGRHSDKYGASNAHESPDGMHIENIWKHEEIEITWNHLKSAVIGMRELKRCAWSYFCHPKIVICLVDRQQAQLVENGGDLGLLAAGSKIGCNGCPYFSAWLFDGPYFTNDFCHTQITQIIQITQITQCSAAVLLEDFQDQCLESTYFDLGLSVANVRGLELQWLLFTSPSDSLQVVPQGILGKL